MNEIIRLGRGNKYAAAKQKHEYTVSVAQYAMGYPQIKKKVDVNIIWFRKNRRCDPDNVAGGGQKVLFDGLVMAGVLEGDRWQHIGCINHDFKIDSKFPRVEVVLIERGNGIEDQC